MSYYSIFGNKTKSCTVFRIDTNCVFKSVMMIKQRNMGTYLRVKGHSSILYYQSSQNKLFCWIKINITNILISTYCLCSFCTHHKTCLQFASVQFLDGIPKKVETIRRSLKCNRFNQEQLLEQLSSIHGVEPPCSILFLHGSLC